MPNVIGVRFKEAGKIYYFDPGNIQDLKVDDYVIVQTARGYEAGQVAIAPHPVPDQEVVGQLKQVVRCASAIDLLAKQRYSLREQQAVEACRAKVAEYNLPMKVVGAEYSFDGNSLVFFFTADKRVDFRDLVRDLARTFRTRIELRQIGVRDEAKLIGGIGPCGRALCCSTYLADFKPVSIKMAKQQDLPLSPMEISGLCGRLLCCLGYEDDYYREAKRQFPKMGDTVDTPDGPGRVCGVNVIKQTLQVFLESEATVEIPWRVPGDEEEEVAAPEDRPAPAPRPAPRPPRRPAPPVQSREPEEAEEPMEPATPAPAPTEQPAEGQPRSNRRSRRRRSRRRPSSGNPQNTTGA